MAFSGDFNKEMVRFGDMDIVFDEKGSRFLTIRKVQWVNKGEEPDESKAKLEMRKFTIGKEGEEICGKGIAFLTEDGPNNLTKELVENGFGSTKEILQSLSRREDFKETVEHLGEDENDSVGEDFFDMRSVLLQAAEEDEVEEEE